MKITFNYLVTDFNEAREIKAPTPELAMAEYMRRSCYPAGTPVELGVYPEAEDSYDYACLCATGHYVA